MDLFRRVALTVGCLTILAALGGCTKDPFREVSGSVTLDGKPIADGEVIFVAEDNGSTPSAGTIKDGRFKCRATVGKKKVQINAVRDTGKIEIGVPVYESIIPERYNSKTQLTAEVADSGPNEYTFELKSK